MKKTNFTLPLSATILAAASPSVVLAQRAQSADYSNRYGPSEADAARVTADRSTNVAQLFQKFGAPYAHYQVGTRTIYRWGAGTTDVRGGIASLVRNEMLVTADADGQIVNVSYKRRYADRGPAALVMDADA